MIESLSKASEIGAKAFESKSTFDPDKFVEKKADNNDFDINKSEKLDDKQTFDPDKKIEKEQPERIKCRNEDLKGQTHPETGVHFEEKTVKNSEGKDVIGVFPEFDSKFDAKLPDNLLQASDKDQFAECNKQLKEGIEKDPELAKKFTPEQIEQIKNGDTPDGYTWHHNEETGKMQLVDSEIHAKTGHTGGKVIWGGGNENR